MRDRTSTTAPASVAEPGALCLFVIGEGLEATHPLPDEGEVLIGRSSEADIRVDHKSVSRAHAVLRIGPPLAVEDQDSSNGTRVRGQRIAKRTPIVVAPGEPIEVGSVLLLVQRRLRPLPRRHIWGVAEFEARVAEECARAERSGTRFAVLHVTCANTEASRAAAEALSAALRAMDSVGEHGPNDFQILLPDSDARGAAETIRRLGEHTAAPPGGVRVGAACYPDDGKDVKTLLGRAVATHAPAPLDSTLVDGGAATAMTTLGRLVERVAPSMINVLIIGETGAGKEILAHRIHRLSPRTAQPFLSLNCAALSETLLESELFGHERGAFTGAVQAKPGLLETAQGGSVFLDEVGELPLGMQAKLLRVIEDRRVLRVGSVKPREIDVRIISATNRDLEAESRRGTFRQDLYFRLNGITLVVPPLRERRDEIPGLTQRLLAEIADRDDRPQARVTDDVRAILLNHGWPGNIRELKNVLARAALLSTDGWIRVENLPDNLRETPPAKASPLPEPPPEPEPDPDADSPRHRRGTVTAARVAETLADCAGNQTEAAKRLGVSRRTLITWIEKHGLARPRKKS